MGDHTIAAPCTKAVIETLFETFDGHLKDQGYLAMGGQIIDASIVAVPKQRNSRKENAGIADFTNTGHRFQ